MAKGQHHTLRVFVATALAGALLVSPTGTPAIASECGSATAPTTGAIATHSDPRLESATFSFRLTDTQLANLRCLAEYVEIDFHIVGKWILPQWDGYVVGPHNLPSAIHDVAANDISDSTPGVTKIPTSLLQANFNYTVTIAWPTLMDQNSGAGVWVAWVPSYWAKDAGQIAVCAWGKIFGQFGDAWCIFPYWLDAYKYQELAMGVDQLPLDGSRVVRFGDWAPAPPPNIALLPTLPSNLPLLPLLPAAPPAPPLSRIVTIDAAYAAWANDNLGQNGWTRQTDAGNAKEMAVGGNRVAVLNTANEVWAKDGLASVGWTQITPTNNSRAVAVSSTGRIVTIDACGAAWANDNISPEGWTRITYCNDTRAIAAGGNRIVIINGCGAAYGRDGMTGPMHQMGPCGDTKAIAVGASGRMMTINNCDSVWASDSFTSGWTQMAPCGNAKAIAVGGSRLVVLNMLGEVWANDNISPGWTQVTPTGNTVAIAAGSSGRIVEIDACGAAWGQDVISPTVWTAETYCGNTLKIAVG
ncbi:MAG TPA: hypothetical protein VM581_00450 [Magnetospirillaceae bacterium]|nr:hypothetical protein [Magnetospirillaceae bacterium]